MAIRMKKESRNLIILGVAIVALVALAIVMVFLYNKYWKKDAQSLSDEKYSSYVISDYSTLLDQEIDTTDGDYLIYVYSSEASDTNLSAVMKYIDKVIKNREDIKNGKSSDYQLALFVIDYAKFDSTSDETEQANAEAIKAELGYTNSAAGTLIFIKDNKLSNTSKQIITSAAKVKQAFKTLTKENKWPYEV